jgi:hypothetical protein
MKSLRADCLTTCAISCHPIPIHNWAWGSSRGMDFTAGCVPQEQGHHLLLFMPMAQRVALDVLHAWEEAWGSSTHNHVSWHQLMPLSYISHAPAAKWTFQGGRLTFLFFLENYLPVQLLQPLIGQGFLHGRPQNPPCHLHWPLGLSFGCNMVNYSLRPGNFCTVSGYSHHQTPLMQARATPSQSPSPYLDRLAVVDLVHSLWSEGGCLESLIINEHTSIESKFQ